jgi:hypothetical protein
MTGPGKYKRTLAHRLAQAALNRTRTKEGLRFLTAQRKAARQRNIPFFLTYEQWLRIWKESGHFHERGRHRGQYVMSRPGDKGPYTVENVKIVLVIENHHEGHVGKKRGSMSEITKARISAANKGRKRAKLSNQAVGSPAGSSQ